ncbi:MAG TPA: LysM domain-containing protein [Chthoniobacteraceae bacterium]|jgi:LysM repeat protein
MTRVKVLWLLLSLMISPVAAIQAQEAPASGEGNELRQIRQLLEQQSKQLEALAQQISKLAQTADFQHSNAAAHQATGSGSSTPPAAASTAPAGPAAGPDGSPASRTATGSGAEIPRAEAVGGSVKHVVAKGETLTSIAKHYNITVADLLKLNKIENDRKLQIGHSINVPSKPEESPTATPTEKKENP